MLRTVRTRLDLDISGRTNMVFSLAVAQGVQLESETLAFVLDGAAAGVPRTRRLPTAPGSSSS